MLLICLILNIWITNLINAFLHVCEGNIIFWVNMIVTEEFTTWSKSSKPHHITYDFQWISCWWFRLWAKFGLFLHFLEMREAKTNQLNVWLLSWCLVLVLILLKIQFSENNIILLQLRKKIDLPLVDVILQPSHHFWFFRMVCILCFW